ncbi:CHAT domain-containing protein [Candidatus Parabeggiatoa sp. HSG14]|uniref:CHAT domain-containing protein n=1 Tax=Candidatus Parabeggiatoa sp. HSG14 TaxID=3055593 RepID=UPI0025A6BAA8|nr:CHAT domain-containing protein [Thiotrichales bacterium HSG14]
MFLISPSVDKLADCPHLHTLAQQLSKRYNTYRVTLEDLKTVGSALWQFLEIDTTLISRTLIIECGDTVVGSLPWECLYHPEFGFLGKHPDYTLSRRVLNNNKVMPLLDGPLNILFWTAQPEKTFHGCACLDIEKEQQTLATALAPFITAGWVRFYAPDDGRFTTFVEILHSQPWHLVLLSGHGIFKQEKNSPLPPYDKGSHSNSLIKGNNGGFFVFENDAGYGELINAHALAQTFKNTMVQCVVVAACQSGQLSASNTSLIMSIAQAGVPHLVGMREPLIDRAGSVFVRTLCLALAQQARIDVAVQKGRHAMTQLLEPNEIWRDPILEKNYSDPNEGQWCLPMLLTCNPTQPLINWHFRPKPILPNPVGHKITLPDIFIGRRRELRTLGDALRTGTIRQLLIQGRGGLGKTALAGRLAMTLAQQRYRILAYQAGGGATFISTLAQALELTHTTCLETLLKKLTCGRWLLWLDNLEHIQNPNNGILTDDFIQSCLERLSYWGKPVDLRILLTSRQTMSQTIACYNYHLIRPSFSDFSRYLQHLGLNYPFPDVLKIYQTLDGNFQGVQLLHSMSSDFETGENEKGEDENLNKQLIIVQRYLQAYLREK